MQGRLRRGGLTQQDTATPTVAGIVPVGKAPHWGPTTSDGQIAYMTNEATDDVSVVELTSRQGLATIPIGNAPRKIAVQPGATVAAASPATATAAPARRASPSR